MIEDVCVIVKSIPVKMRTACVLVCDSTILNSLKNTCIFSDYRNDNNGLRYLDIGNNFE